MNQQQKIAKAKWCGLCLGGLLCSLGGLVWAVWRDSSLAVLLLMVVLFSYNLYQTVITDAYFILFYALNKYRKCSRLHGFFERKKESAQSNNFWILSSRHQPKNSLHQGDKNPPQDQQEEASVYRMVPEVSPGTEKKKEEKMRLFVDRKKGVNVKHKEIPAELIVDKVVNTEEFLTARDNYKKTVRFFESKGVKAEVLEQICSLAKNDYTKKVEQLIEMSEDNEKAIIAVAEQYFEVRVMAEKERPPEKVEPIWLDQIVDRVKLLGFTGCLPWTPKSLEEKQFKKAQNTLKDLVNLRVKIDQALSSHSSLNQKTREQLCLRLKKQLGDSVSAGRDLLNVLVALFNQNVRTKEYKLWVRRVGEKMEGVEVVETWIGDRYHANLRVAREEKSELYSVKPGEDNLWSLLGVAAEIMRLKQ